MKIKRKRDRDWPIFYKKEKPTTNWIVPTWTKVDSDYLKIVLKYFNKTKLSNQIYKIVCFSRAGRGCGQRWIEWLSRHGFIFYGGIGTNLLAFAISMKWL